MVEATDTIATLTLDSSAYYELQHTERTTAGGASAVDVQISVNGATPGYAAGADVFVLSPGKTIAIGPGLLQLSLITPSGSALVGITSSGRQR